MNLEKCKNCKEMNCIIAKTIFKTNLGIDVIKKKEDALFEELNHYRTQSKELNDFGIKYTLSKNQLNILKLVNNKESEIVIQIIDLYN